MRALKVTRKRPMRKTAGSLSWPAVLLRQSRCIHTYAAPFVVALLSCARESSIAWPVALGLLCTYHGVSAVDHGARAVMLLAGRVLRPGYWVLAHRAVHGARDRFSAGPSFGDHACIRAARTSTI